MSEKETPTTKETILQYIERFEFVTWHMLFSALEESMPDVNNGEKLKCLSELIQAGSIKRLAYILNGRNERRQLYCLGDTKLMF